MNHPTSSAWAAVCICIGTLTSGLASAQVQAPQPGAIGAELLRQQEREIERLRSNPPPAGPALQALPQRDSTTPAGQDVRFELKSIEFGRSSILSPEALAAVAAPYQGRTVSFNELQAVIDAVNALYDQQGFATARAVLPAQRVSNGAVRVELVEGRIGQVRLQGNTYMRPDPVVQSIGLKAGELVNPRELEAELSRYNRVSQASVSAALQPGEGYGLTDVYLTLNEPRRNRLDLFANNHGYASTGEVTAGLIYRHHGALGLDDAFLAFLSHSEGSRAVSLAYDLPFNRWGGRVGLRAGSSQAKVVAGAFAGIRSQGDSDNVHLTLSQPLWSSRDWLWTAHLSHGKHQSVNTVSGVFLNENQVTSTRVELTAEYAAPHRTVHLGLNAQQITSEMLGTPRRERFTVWGGSWLLNQAWTTGFNTTLGGAWQHAQRNGLPSSHVFQIGGPSTVRGYTQGELAGDGGVFLSLQGNQRVSPTLTLYGFIDHGRIDASFRQPEQLTSIGAGAIWSIHRQLTGELSLGLPMRNMRPGQDKALLHGRLIWSVL